MKSGTRMVATDGGFHFRYTYWIRKLTVVLWEHFVRGRSTLYVLRGTRDRTSFVAFLKYSPPCDLSLFFLLRQYNKCIYVSYIDTV